MSKELLALEKIKLLYKSYVEKIGMNFNDMKGFDFGLAYIEKALKRLEQTDNAKPSEALECIKELYKERAYAYDDKVMHKGNGWSEAIKHYDNIGECLLTIEQALLKAQEQEKVFEIIVENRIDVYALIIAYDLKDYNEMIKHTYELTQEEFELLKRWLNEKDN